MCQLLPEPTSAAVFIMLTNAQLYGSRLAHVVQLLRKSIVASGAQNIYDIDFSYSSATFIEFRVYRRGDSKTILMWETLQMTSDEFEEKADRIEVVLDNVITNGIMPDIYNFYLSTSEEDEV